MSKVGGHRNFGYGKQMEWAGRQALSDRYGDGHYGTVAGHAERWRRFVAWCRDERQIRRAGGKCVLSSRQERAEQLVAEATAGAMERALSQARRFGQEVRVNTAA